MSSAPAAPESAAAAPVRLQKFLVERGAVPARRKAEEWIAAGRVTVNGVVADLGRKVDPAADRVEVDGRPVGGAARSPRTILLHKPAGVLSSRSDPHHDRTVYDLLPAALREEGLAIAGRLDKDSAGLLVLSSDGDLVHALTHPSSEVPKVYRAWVDRPLERAHAARMRAGIEDEGEILRADAVRWPDPRDPCLVEVRLHQGRKREVRRLLAAGGVRVRSLVRIRIGGIELGDLPPGAWRELDAAQQRRLLEGGRE